jgi:hypothetical protein
MLNIVLFIDVMVCYWLNYNYIEKPLFPQMKNDLDSCHPERQRRILIA